MISKAPEGSFKEYKNLRFHQREKHRNGLAIARKLKCELCDKEFTPSQLKTHIKRIHEAKKEVQCDFCSKYFPSITNLNKHTLRVHSDNTIERIHKCDPG